MSRWQNGWNNIARTGSTCIRGSPCPEICRLSKPIYGLPLSDPSGGGLLRLPDGADQSRHLLQCCAKVDPGLSECGFGGASDILEQGDEYYITLWREATSTGAALEKGVNHNALYCLRIYFFWDEKSSMW